MKKSTRLIRLLSSMTIMVLVFNSCLIPETIYASSTSQEILDSESDGSESKTVVKGKSNKDNSEKDNRVLDCKNTVHKHTKGCYDEEGNIICGYADFVVHTHDKNCYDSKGKLVCKLPEIEEHTHSEECYGSIDGENEEVESQNQEIENKEIEFHEMETQQGDMIIIMDEPLPLKEEQKASDKELICQKEEIKLHTHTMICLDGDGNLICGKLEVTSHQHTEGCFKTVQTTSKSIKMTNTVKPQTSSQTITNSISDSISEEANNAQATEYSKTESGSLPWAFGIFGIIILILAAAIIGYCIIYRKKSESIKD